MASNTEKRKFYVQVRTFVVSQLKCRIWTLYEKSLDMPGIKELIDDAMMASFL